MDAGIALWLFVLVVLAARRSRRRRRMSPIASISPGSPSRPVQDALKNASQLVALAGRPPDSPAALRRRANDDLPRLAAVMHAEGYWQARVAYRIDTAAHPARVTRDGDAGTAFSSCPGRLRARFGSAGGAGCGHGRGRHRSYAGRRRALGAGRGRQRPHRRALWPERLSLRPGERPPRRGRCRDRHHGGHLYDRSGAPARFGATAIHGLHRVARDFVTRARRLERRCNLRCAQGRGDPPGIGALRPVQRHSHPPRRRTRCRRHGGDDHRRDRGSAALGRRRHRLQHQSRPWRAHLLGAPQSLRRGRGFAVLGRRGAEPARARRRFPPARFPRTQDRPRRQCRAAAASPPPAYDSRRWRGYVGLEDVAQPPYTLGGGVSIERAYLAETTRDENYLLLGLPFYRAARYQQRPARSRPPARARR